MVWTLARSNQFRNQRPIRDEPLPPNYSSTSSLWHTIYTKPQLWYTQRLAHLRTKHGVISACSLQQSEAPLLWSTISLVGFGVTGNILGGWVTLSSVLLPYWSEVCSFFVYSGVSLRDRFRDRADLLFPWQEAPLGLWLMQQLPLSPFFSSLSLLSTGVKTGWVWIVVSLKLYGVVFGALRPQTL